MASSRYLKVLRKNLLVIIVIIALIVASSVTKGKLSKTLSIITGLVMILSAVLFIIWLVKTPTRKEKDELQ